MALGAVDSCDQMNALVTIDEATPLVAMKVLVEQHGAWTVLRALAAVLMPKRRKVVPLEHLSAHMRRDIGLPPLEEHRQYRELR